MRALPPASGFAVNGVGLGTVAQAAIRAARARRGEAAPMAEPMPAVSNAGRLATVLRGYPLPLLTLEMERLAQIAAIHRENVEGLAYGRTYGDHSLAALDPAPCLLPILAEATQRADMAGALADLLRAMIGRETAVSHALTEGAGV